MNEPLWRIRVPRAEEHCGGVASKGHPARPLQRDPSLVFIEPLQALAIASMTPEGAQTKLIGNI